MGLEMLDVVIGMIFVFLTLSLVCSAVNEIIEAWLNKRSDYLERGIKELLSHSGLVKDVYEHPLIAGLFRGNYEDNKKSLLSYLPEGLVKFFKKDYKKVLLPSYIPAENFALALIDTILPKNDLNFTPGTDSKPTLIDPNSIPAETPPLNPPAHTPPTSVLESSKLKFLQKAIDDKIKGLGDEIKILTGVIDALTSKEEKKNAPKEVEIVSKEKEKTSKEGFVKSMEALRALVNAAGNEPEKVKKNVENWFNNSMDRVSGWYKRRTQVIIMIIGIGVAFGVNADSLTIVNSLSHDKALRDSLVVAAGEYSKTAAQTSPTPAAMPTADGKPAPAAAPVEADKKFAEACEKSKNNKGLCRPDCLKNVNLPECKFDAEMAKIKELGLPIGWDNSNPTLAFPKDLPSLMLKIFGLLLTAFAISLGAPFWFDLLNKFMVIRSTVKPKEKSPNEPSKS